MFSLMKLLQCSEMPEFGRVFLQLNWTDLLFPESDLILKRKCHSVLLISFTHFIRGMPRRWFPVRTAQSQNPNVYKHSFSSPEPTIFVVCDRNRELWEQPFWNSKGNNRILPIRFHAVCIYGACLKWLLPELSIPAAGQKDRRLWGREW